MLFGQKKRQKKDRDALQNAKMEESHRALLAAATATANAAHDVTIILKSKLEDSVKRFESTSHLLKDALFLTDMNGVIQHANIAAETLFGSGIVGTKIMALFRKGSSKIRKPESLWTALAETPCKLRGMRANGTCFEFEPRVERLDWQDKTSSMLVIIYDMSAVVKLHHHILESSFDGIIVAQNGVIIAANSNIQRLYGYQAEDLLGCEISKLFVDGEAISSKEHGCGPINGVHENGALIKLIYTTGTIDWKNSPARIITVKEAN